MNWSAEHFAVFSSRSLNAKRGHLAVLSITLAGLVLYAGSSRAEVWRQTVSTRVMTEYETNPAMSATKQESIWREMVDPGYMLAGTLGANELNAGASVHIERSSNKALRQDREDPTVFFSWKRTGETGEFGIAGKYNEIATRSTEYDGLGLVLTDGTRVTRNVSASWKKALSDLSTLDVNEAYTKTTFQGGTFTDYALQTGGVMYSYVWNERISSFFRASYDDYSSVASSHSRRYSAMAGLNWTSSEQLAGSFQIGQSRGDGAGSGRSSQGVASVQYKGQQTTSSLSASRLVVASGLGGFTTTKRVNGSWTYELDERDRTGVDVGWAKSYLVTESTSRTSGIWLQRELNSFWVARLNILRRIVGGDGVQSASSNVLGLSFSYTDPHF